MTILSMENATYVELIVRHCNISPELLKIDDSMEELCKGNPYKLGLLLLDLCELSDQAFEFEESKGFSQYPTVGFVLAAFSEKKKKVVSHD